MHKQASNQLNLVGAIGIVIPTKNFLKKLVDGISFGLRFREGESFKTKRKGKNVAF